MKKAIILCAVVAACFSPQLTKASVLLNETFADGTRTTQSPPSSLDWFASVPGATTTTSGSVSIAGSTTARQLVGYFTVGGYGSPVSLQVGETITVSLNMTFAGTLGSGTGNLMRLGLFNSGGGTRFTEDSQNPNPLGDGYGGYVANINNAGGQITTQILERNISPSTGALLTNSGAYTVHATGTPITDTFSTSVTYGFQLSIVRLDAGTIQLNSIISGGDLVSSVTASYTDTSSLNTAFDTIGFTAFGGSSSTGSSLTTFSNIQINQVPEPSTIAMLAMGLLIGAVYRYRRVRA